MENHDRYLEVVWGCHYAGLVYTCASSRLQTSELEYIIDDCGARAFITSKYKSEQAEELRDKMPGVELRLMLDTTVDGYDSYEAVVADMPATPLDEERKAGLDMLYSSGTTGRPKGITREYPGAPLETEGGPIVGLLQLLYGFDDSKRYLSPAPMYHAAPLRFCLAVHSIGATLVAMEQFDAEEYLALVDRYDVTHSQVVPTMFVRMLKLPDETRERYDVSSLEAVIHAAAPCPIPVKKQMIEWFGPVINEYYAGSEGNGFVCCNSEQWLAHEGTVGQALIGTVHIVGDDYLYLTDRKAYMIITGGVNVYPQEAENLLVTHPKVIDVAVFGVPNDDFGEEVKAVVQPKEMPADDAAAAALAGELIQFCRSELADVKCPRSIDFRDELPRHPTGKLYKRLLKDEYWTAAGRAI